MLTEPKELWRYADDRVMVYGVRDCAVCMVACVWKRQCLRQKYSSCTCEFAQLVLCCEACWTSFHLELQVVVGRWTRWSIKEEIVCVLAEMRFGPGLGNTGPSVLCHLAGLGAETCLQALTLPSSAYGRQMFIDTRAAIEVFVEALTSACIAYGSLIG